MTDTTKRILFMGTPDIAATCLSALTDAGYRVVGAVCQPDKPKGRGYTLQPPPVKVRALELGIPVFQPETLKDGAFDATLKELAPDLVAVVAYGKILPPSLIHFPAYGCVNVHASLLPKYRGAAPMQRAIIDGEAETGVTTMLMDEGLDTGDMLLVESFPIGEEDNFETVHDRTATLGGKLLCRTVEGLFAGTLTPIPQPEGATYAAKITKEDCLLDFTRPAKALAAQVRGLSPIPLSYTTLPDGRLLKVAAAHVAEGTGECGRVIAVSDKGEGGITVATGDGAIVLTKVKPEGKGLMTAADLLRGRRIALGDLLGGSTL